METYLWHLLLDRKLYGTAMSVWMLWQREVPFVWQHSHPSHPAHTLVSISGQFITLSSPEVKAGYTIHTFVNVAEMTRIYAKFSKLPPSLGLQ